MMNYVTRDQFLNEKLVGFRLWDSCKFFNTVILESDTDLSDADKCFIRRLPKRFATVGVFPRTARFFIEKLVCAERDNTGLVIDT